MVPQGPQLDMDANLLLHARKKEGGGRGLDLIVGGLHPHDLMNYNSLTEWECERSIQVICPSLLPETCEILCRESKAEGSHAK